MELSITVKEDCMHTVPLEIVLENHKCTVKKQIHYIGTDERSMLIDYTDSGLTVAELRELIRRYE